MVSLLLWMASQTALTPSSCTVSGFSDTPPALATRQIVCFQQLWTAHVLDVSLSDGASSACQR